LSIRFNGVDIPSFVLVNDIKTSILPPVKQNLVNVRGRPGSYDFGNELGEREITIDITIEATSAQQLRQQCEIELGKWLYYDEAKELIILDDPTRHYMAKVTGDTDLSQIISIGQGSITFLCTDPHRYGTEKIIPFNPAAPDPVFIENQGGVDTFPVIEVEFAQDTTEFSIVSDTDYLYFGQPASVDNMSAVPKRTQIFYDDGSSVAGWTAGTGVDGGDITGSLESTGGYIRQLNNDYGSGAKWHGAAGVKTFGQELQDFTLETNIGFKAGYPYQIGRVEVYLLDINNVRIGKIALRDTSAYTETTYVECRIGPVSGGRYLVASEIGKGYYVDFFGKLTIQRIGQRWYFEIGKRREDGTYWGRWSTQFIDKNNAYQTKVAGVQIHFAAYGTYQPFSTVYVEDIRVWKENAVDPGTQVPYIFYAGDRLLIDCNTGTILKNGVPFFDALDPTSNYIRLRPGMNGIVAAPAIITNGSIRFKERWL
jgi:predicted phage tail component-like protein